MLKLKSILILMPFIISIFFVQTSFINPTTSTVYYFNLCCLILTIIFLVQKTNLNRKIRLSNEIIFIILLYFLVLLYNRKFTHVQLISYFSLIIFYLLLKESDYIKNWILIGIVFIGIIESFWGLGQYFRIFENKISTFRISGSFDNPAGLSCALSIIVPITVNLFLEAKKVWKFIFAMAFVLFSLTIMLSGSRTGVISLAIIIGLFIINKGNYNVISNKKYFKILILFITLIILLSGLYFIKKDSSRGRLLIWNCTLNMISDNPVLGKGEGGFQREYMLYQANYFKSHPNSEYSMLADNVKHPFNEFLLILVEHGLLGAIVIVFGAIFLIKAYYKSENKIKQCYLISLIVIITFSFFSYPINYLFVRIFGIFCIAQILKYYNEADHFIQISLKTLRMPSFLLCLICIYINQNNYIKEYEWNRIAQKSLKGDTKNEIQEYEKLYKSMNTNGLFLYNYGAELNYNKRYDESNFILNECLKYYNDSDLQMILANNNENLEKINVAEHNLLLAHEMTPNRFFPLYRLAKLYQNTGDSIKALKFAKCILNKKIKIESPEIFAIKFEMKMLIKNFHKVDSCEYHHMHS